MKDGNNEYTIPNLMYTPSGIIFEINKFLSMGYEHGKFKTNLDFLKTKIIL